MFRISRLGDYAVTMLVALWRINKTEGGEGCCSATLLAKKTGLSQTTVAKILKILAQKGIVCSQRGVQGGYRIAKPLDDITIADILSAVDGSLVLTRCLSNNPQDLCRVEGLCHAHDAWGALNEAVKQIFERATLKAFVEGWVPFTQEGIR